MSGKESTIRNLNSEVAYHKNEAGKKRKQIEKLKKTIDNKDEHNKSIRTEKETLKLDLTNKSLILTRCTDAIRNVRDQMRKLRAKAKSEEIKTAIYREGIKKIRKKHEKEEGMRKGKNEWQKWKMKCSLMRLQT